MPQNEHIELHQKRFGRRLDAAERERKKAARVHRVRSKQARRLRGLKAKLQHQQQHVEKVVLRKKILQHQVKTARQKAKNRSNNDDDDDEGNKDKNKKQPQQGALPAYLLDRDKIQRTKVLSNMVKQKRKEKAGKWTVPIQKVQALREDEMFRVLRTGKRKRKMWKRMVHKVCFVGQDFTRKPPKLERYVRPTGLRFNKAHVTHPELKTTFYLDIVSVKKNPQSQLYTSLGVITKGTILEVNVSDLGLVTQTGKVVWAKYAQVTNNPELDGCINAVLLV